LASSPQTAAAAAAVVGSGAIVGSDDLAQAEALVSKLGKLYGVVPDATTVNSLIQIACQPRRAKSSGNLGSHQPNHELFHWAPHLASGLMGRAEAYVRLLERAHDGAWLVRDDTENGIDLEELHDIDLEVEVEGGIRLSEERKGGGENGDATADFCLLFEESSPSFSFEEISYDGDNEGGSSSSVDDPHSKRRQMTRLTRQGRNWWREVQFSLEESLLSPEKKASRSFSHHEFSPAAQQQKSQRSHKQKQQKQKKEQQGEGQQQHKQLAVAYTSLLVGYARSGDLKRAIDVFARRMPSRGGCCYLGIMIDLLKSGIEG